MRSSASVDAGELHRTDGSVGLVDLVSEWFCCKCGIAEVTCLFVDAKIVGQT